MAKRRWSDLSERTRRLIVLTGAVEGALKAAALVDLRRRPAEEVRGSKKVWAVAIVLVNSAGALPIGYFALGRRPGD
ncbi:MAG TPA: hypothetical protein VFM09_06225 [Marmoricola sp.]|nr:hypothetical protein [Marmoricola sp.]